MTTIDTDIKVKPNLDIDTEEFVNIVHNSQTGEAIIIPYTEAEKTELLSRRAAFAAAQAQMKIDTDAKEAERAALEVKATTKPVNEEKLLASLPDDALREIILNLWARVAYLETKLGVDHKAAEK